MTPPKTFTIISLLLIAAMVIATSLTQSSFYRQAIIDRESVIIREVVGALALEQGLAAQDMEHYADYAVQEKFAHSFSSLRSLSGEVRIKVFNRDGTIVWSDERHLIGKSITVHATDLARAMAGEVRAVFNDADRPSSPDEALPRVPLIEFYVPFSLAGPGTAGAAISGVLSLYRSPQQLNDTVRHGLLLLWSVTGLAGAVLFAALYRLFRSVYFRQREAESQFARLSTEHEHLVQIEKLSAMGQMVSEIAHQLNNPLVGVVNLAELAEREAGNPERVSELLGDIRRAGSHCRGFVQRMLRFNQVARSEPQRIELKALVRDTISFFRQSVGGQPAVGFEAPDHDVTLEVDPVLIRHALFNLIHNAVQAKPDAPVVVSLAGDHRQDRRGWRLTVSDAGPGLVPEVAAKLFTPFFTTRPGGTGLGLTVAQHIAVQHGGSIHAENNPGAGASFSIWLPADTRTQS